MSLAMHTESRTIADRTSAAPGRSRSHQVPPLTSHLSLRLVSCMCCQNWSEVDIHVSVLGLTLSNLTSILLLAAGICGLIGVGHGQVLALVVASVAFGACNIVTTLFAAYLVWRHKQWA